MTISTTLSHDTCEFYGIVPLCGHRAKKTTGRGRSFHAAALVEAGMRGMPYRVGRLGGSRKVQPQALPESPGRPGGRI